MKRSSNPIASGKILIKNGRSYYFVNINDINFIESEGNYSRLFCDKRNFIVKKSLIFLEGKLGVDKFMRVNKSTIVNIDRIDEMKESENNNFLIVLNNSKTLQWGRRYRERLVKLIRI